MELTPAPAVVILGNRFIGNVYSRRPKLQAEASMLQRASPSPTDIFINQVTKPLQSALPTPVLQKRGSRQPRVMTKPPRRSRQVANLPPKVNNHAAAVCRTLGFEEFQTEATYDKYQKFWATPLVRNHVKDMVTMIGKVLPEDTTLPVAGGITGLMCVLVLGRLSLF